MKRIYSIEMFLEQGGIIPFQYCYIEEGIFDLRGAIVNLEMDKSLSQLTSYYY